ncbi:hypothetical protein DCW30_26675 [Streptomyces alfalfae]|uniref:Uncharacterized protein n=1 Tax=Streptomyces alfalfae TaxID=1642299 RepID=A0ABM6GPG9_9ACTN|nr:hypothetical protein [Streptomyces alfalfae]AYA16130.1 hypothetical protein D3X13_07760 [Streptomyces fradiae]APY85771.1 hypothetical protein A7J05_08640 [Streptomyces alfalfae]QUI34498.1 hypothetical protein H9W91_29330 [Streptomyces alfalfae]RXX39602.1 hypothetical protein DCW30_26675 [Streptomyces alfalfae]RZN03687.1 hypothetical protein D4104_04430 [Streptomyces alfalfae]
MIKDPEAGREGPFPYDALAPAGVTPWTTHADMRDVSFELLARHLMTPVTQQAWDELRGVRRRLLVDLLLYDVDMEAELPLAAAEIDRELALEAAPQDPQQAAEQDPPPDSLPEATARLVADLVRFDV